MEQILEIRDGCNTPTQLIKSLTFSRYLKIYKNEFIEEMNQKKGKLESEAAHKIAFIKDVTARDFLNILDKEIKSSSDVSEKDKSLIRFFDGGYHHFRVTAYSRLIRLRNTVVSGSEETAERVKEKVTEKATELSDLILETRRELLKKGHMDQGVRRSHGLDASPNVTAGEISGHYLNLPADYIALSAVPLTIAADIQTGIDYSTPSNKRAYPFYELDYNPFNEDAFNHEEWVSVPLQVGMSLIICYIHKSRGCIEMEPGILNLFPFANVQEINDGRRPDGIFIFGDPNAKREDLGYYVDKENDVLVGLVPSFDELKYFGYAKKPILTIHNVLTIQRGEIPLHCGCTRYEVHFEEDNTPYIAEMFIKADDMGRICLEKNNKNKRVPMFYGTETGAFACLDGFSEQAKIQMQGREVGYNNDMGSNARQIVPVTMDDEVLTGDPLDILMYMNNYTIINKGEPTVSQMGLSEAIEHLRLGERVAAGSTQTHRGSKESSYWANPFPLLKEADGSIIHPDLYEQFLSNEQDFIESAQPLINKDEFIMGVAHSQLMGGAFKDNSDEDIERCGFTNREEVEQEGPVRLAEDLIDLIKSVAINKRKDNANEVSVTVALVGDSRTGKSETAEKMEGILGLQSI